MLRSTLTQGQAHCGLWAPPARSPDLVNRPTGTQLYSLTSMFTDGHGSSPTATTQVSSWSAKLEILFGSLQRSLLSPAPRNLYVLSRCPLVKTILFAYWYLTYIYNLLFNVTVFRVGIQS